jgi:flagellar biogenesis protein FliO
MATVLRVILSTALVLGAIWYAARVVRKPGKISTRLRLSTSGSLIESRSALNRTTTIAVIRFGGQQHLIAANETAIQLLASSDVAMSLPAQSEAHTSTETTHDQLEAVRTSLQATSFADVLRGYTARSHVKPQ